MARTRGSSLAVAYGTPRKPHTLACSSGQRCSSSSSLYTALTARRPAPSTSHDVCDALNERACSLPTELVTHDAQYVSATSVLPFHGAMRCAEVDASASGVVLCRGHDPAEVVQPWRSYNRASLPDIVATVGVHFRHAFAPDALIDPQSEGRLGVAPRESTAPLVYSVAHSMEWLEFDAPARRLHGTPPRPGTWNVTVTATDPGLAVGDVWHGKARAYLETPLTAVDSFLLHVREVPADASEDYWEADSVARNPQAAGLA